MTIKVDMIMYMMSRGDCWLDDDIIVIGGMGPQFWDNMVNQYTPPIDTLTADQLKEQ